MRGARRVREESAEVSEKLRDATFLRPVLCSQERERERERTKSFVNRGLRARTWRITTSCCYDAVLIFHTPFGLGFHTGGYRLT
ncbi:hypothetical protein E2542_SST00386 [Spatholobus suberectus]|nr:hypothetical protein E2542_SST00386 [Spatholobus suberectus]